MFINFARTNIFMENQKEVDEGKLKFEATTSVKKLDINGKIVKEYNKKSEGTLNINEFNDTKICIDANMMILAILKPDFKKLLIENKGDDMPFTTESFKKEAVRNIYKIKKISEEEAGREFGDFEKEIGLKYLEFKDNYTDEGMDLFSKVMKFGIKIKKLSTFLTDCVNLVTIKNNNVSVLFTNDEDLAKVCRNFLKNIKIIKIQADSNKVIKDHFKFYKKGRKSKRWPFFDFH